MGGSMWWKYSSTRLRLAGWTAVRNWQTIEGVPHGGSGTWTRDVITIEASAQIESGAMWWRCW
jgi:hypothetical protein